MTAVLGTVLIGSAALAIDVSVWEDNVGTMQGAADQAALAASVALSAGKTAAQNEAQGVAATHGFANGTGGVVVTTNIPPKAGGYTSSASNPQAVEVVITQPQTTLLSGVLSLSPTVATVRAVAASASAVPALATCILMLDPTRSGISSTGVANIGAPSCNIDVNSTNPCDISTIGLSSVTAYDLALGGSQAGCALGLVGLSVNDLLKGGKPQLNAPPALDPYSSRTIPKPSSPCQPINTFLQINITLKPGTYCGLSLLGGQSVTLDSGPNGGVYIFDGGGINSVGANSITGNNATLVFTSSNGSDYGGITGIGALAMNLTPMTSGPTAGMAVWLDKAGRKPVTAVGGILLNITGAFYAPGSDVTLAGVGSSPCTQLIANTMSIVGAAAFNHNCSGLGVADVGNAAGYKLVE